MLTSLQRKEARCAYKGHNYAFDFGSRTAYSFGRIVLYKHFEQPSLTLLHKICNFIRFQIGKLLINSSE